MTEKAYPVAAAASVQVEKSYAELYAEYFVPAQNAVRGAGPAQAMPFKIFSLTNNNVNIVYSNGSGM